MQSALFLDLYDALPHDAQHALVHRHLAPLLDAVPADARSRAVAAASDLHRRYARMPRLRLDLKKAEITALVHDLSRESRRTLLRERSRAELLLAEAVDSVASWLPDIWQVAFEFRADFALAHAALLYCSDALNQIAGACGCCKCSFTTMFVPLAITRSSGKLVKSFSLYGAQNLESVLLWIWRDLLLAFLATSSQRQRSLVPAMIQEIRLSLGWRALELLVHGGVRPSTDVDVDSEDDDSALHIGNVPDDGSIVCDEQLYSKSIYAPHWSWRITNLQPRLRDLVHDALFRLFEAAPTEELYSSILAIAEDEAAMEEQLHPVLMSTAGLSSDNLAAALRILALDNCPEYIDKLLTVNKHLLRPQDAPALQLAVASLSSNCLYRTHAMSILEEELLDIAAVFRAAVRSAFSNVDSQSNKAELTRILALPKSQPIARRARVERWVKAILTPKMDTPHPMALAAIMMGIPIPPGTDDDGDMLGSFDISDDEPESEALMEEFRPNIKGRFHGWLDTAVTIKGGQTLLTKMYAKLIADMPFLKAGDIVEEMCSQITDRPSKAHIMAALEVIKEFCEQQRRKVAKAGLAKTKKSNSGSGLTDSITQRAD